MTMITCDSLSQLLDAIARLPEKPVGEVNFFSSGGRGYLEKPASDLLALFMGGTAQVPCWLSKALLHCLAGRGLIETSDLEQADWHSVGAEREIACKADQAEASKRLDLLVEDTISSSVSKTRFMPARPRILSGFMNPCSKPARITDKYSNAFCVPRRRPAMCRQIGR